MTGEEIVIAKGDTPMVRLVPIAKGGFRIGILGSSLGPGPDFLAPAAEDDLTTWEAEPKPPDAAGP